jgi:hypothetical protein
VAAFPGHQEVEQHAVKDNHSHEHGQEPEEQLNVPLAGPVPQEIDKLGGKEFQGSALANRRRALHVSILQCGGLYVAVKLIR